MKSRSLPKPILFILTCLILPFAVSAQETQEPLYFNATVQNMHLWRGYKVSTNTLTTLNAGYKSKDGSFSAGLWNGSSFNGSYTEFDYYISYTLKNGLSFSVWDINNFSDFPNADIFDYNKETTSHFIDVTVAYPFTNSLRLSVSTIVAGRDTYPDDDDNLKSAFSTYIEAQYRVLSGKDVHLDAFLGGAFSPMAEKHFYGSTPNIVNVGLSAGTTVNVFNGQLPVSARAMWNPELKYGAMELAVTIF